MVINDITLLVPSKESFLSRMTSLSETLFHMNNNLPYTKHLPEHFSIFSHKYSFSLYFSTKFELLVDPST